MIIDKAVNLQEKNIDFKDFTDKCWVVIFIVTLFFNNLP